AVFAVEGHPVIYNTPVGLVRKEAETQGWLVTVHPAISSLDTILNDLGLRMEDRGLQIVDAGRMLMRRTTLNPEMDCLLMQMAACEEPGFVPVRGQTPRMFEGLRSWLGRFYPPSHPLHIIR